MSEIPKKMRGMGMVIILVREVLKNNLLLMTNILTTWAGSTMALSLTVTSAEELTTVSVTNNLQHCFQDYPHLEDHAGLSRQTILKI